MPILFRSLYSRATRTVLGLLGILAGIVFLFGDPAKWQHTPSLDFLANVPLLPVAFWGWLAIAYGICMLVPDALVAGYCLGAFLFAVVAVCLLWTLHTPGPKNIFATVGVIDAMAYHLVAIQYAVLGRGK